MLSFLLSFAETEEQESQIRTIYEEYYQLMKHIAKKYLHEEDLAEDAVQDAMLHIIDRIRTRGDLDPMRIKSLVCLIAKSAAINIYRKEKVRNGISLDDESVLYQPASYDDYMSLRYAEVRQAIDQLPQPYRDVLQLKAQHELSDKEIAKVLHISHAAVRKRLERARKELLDKWRDEDV